MKKEAKKGMLKVIHWTTWDTVCVSYLNAMVQLLGLLSTQVGLTSSNLDVWY